MSKTAYGSVLKVVAMAMFVASTCRGWVCTASLPEGATRALLHPSGSTTRLTPRRRKPRFWARRSSSGPTSTLDNPVRRMT